MRTVAWCSWTPRRGRGRRSRSTSPPPGGKRKRHEPAAFDSRRGRRDGDPGRAPDPVERGRVRRHHRPRWESGARGAEGEPARHRAHGHQDAGRLGHRDPRRRAGAGPRDPRDPHDRPGLAPERDPGGEPGGVLLHPEAVLERRPRRDLPARGGTFFLDEIGEMSPATQVKLLRVLQEREAIPVGGTEAIPVDVRVVAATNRDLEDDIKRGRFRTDLYYRLNVINIHLPPLRDRREDIPIFVSAFLEHIAKEHGDKAKELSAEAHEVIMAYDWPGNVRELENASSGPSSSPRERTSRARRSPT